MNVSDSGTLYGSVTDDQGEALPGVTTTLTGDGPPQLQVTDAEGKFNFPELAPGTYVLSAELEGFSPIKYPNISIAAARTTTIRVILESAIR